MTRSARSPAPEGSAANLGFEAELWGAADTLRGNIESAEYKHVVLGLIFLKYVSDAFDERHAELVQEADADAGVDPEDRDEYLAKNVFWLPPEARWGFLRDRARSPEIGKRIDEAMAAIESANPVLRGVLPRDYARPALDKARLGQLVDRFSNLGLGGKEHQARDTLGRVYEYFLGGFASAEGRRGGEFYTPTCVVRLLVEMLQPRPNSRIFDPCCGSGGMFVQSERFIRDHGGRPFSAALYGQELNHTTRRLCVMNLVIRGMSADVREGDSFLKDQFPDLRADFVLANPPFNMSAWGGEALREDGRWKYGVPPAGNANYAWIQHFIHHLAPQGMAGFVMANGSMATNTSSEGDIRRALIEADLVDCMVSLPGQLFYTTQIPVCLWFLAKNKKGGGVQRDRSGQVLFLNAQKLGPLIDRTHRELTADDIGLLARTYHAWQGQKEAGAYADQAGFCKSATLEAIRSHGHALTPGRYVGAAEVDDDGEPFEEKMQRLTAELRKQLTESARLDAAIRDNLRRLGYEV